MAKHTRLGKKQIPGETVLKRQPRLLTNLLPKATCKIGLLVLLARCLVRTPRKNRYKPLSLELTVRTGVPTRASILQDRK